MGVAPHPTQFGAPTQFASQIATNSTGHFFDFYATKLTTFPCFWRGRGVDQNKPPPHVSAAEIVLKNYHFCSKKGWCWGCTGGIGDRVYLKSRFTKSNSPFWSLSLGLGVPPKILQPRG